MSGEVLIDLNEAEDTTVVRWLCCDHVVMRYVIDEAREVVECHAEDGDGPGPLVVLIQGQRAFHAVKNLINAVHAVQESANYRGKLLEEIAERNTREVGR